jgi:hypothetical protein
VDILLAPVVLTAAGYFARARIVALIERIAVAVKAGLFVYGLVLFFGERAGIENDWQLLIITVTTALLFNLQFWAFSDSRIAKA